jgi:hypothetical protein
MPVQFRFAMLELLARRPDGCASIDELWSEWEAIAEDEGSTADRFSEFVETDLLQAGLLVLEGDDLHITDAGRSVLRALDALNQLPTQSGLHDQSQSLRTIDNLIGTEQRLKIFDLGVRVPGEIRDLAPLEEQRLVEQAMQTETDAIADDEAEATAAAEAADETVALQVRAWPGELGAPDFDLPNAQSFLKPDFGSRIRMPTRLARRGLKLPAALVSQFGRFSHILRGHLAEGSSSIKTDGRPAGISGAVIAALSLLVILIAAGLFIGVNQIKNLKSEITALERQLVPLKKQVANAEQQEKKNIAEQKDLSQDQPPVPGVAQEGKSSTENGPLPRLPTTLQLSPDEMRLIREYIKPAPFIGPAAPSINLGDPVSVATIPLPSPLTDRVPKLLGGRFTIRNGSIIILKRDSRQADAVLAPN